MVCLGKNKLKGHKILEWLPGSHSASLEQVKQDCNSLGTCAAAYSLHLLNPIC